MSATAIRQGRASQMHRQSFHAISRRSEADVYAEITRAWWSMYSDHLDYVMRPFVVANDFARAVWDESVANPDHTIGACARIISTDGWQLRDAVPLGGKFYFTELLDPASAWWLALGEESGMGVHFWRLVNNTIEFRSIGSFDEAPTLYFGRFAEREARREREAARRIALATSRRTPRARRRGLELRRVPGE